SGVRGVMPSDQSEGLPTAVKLLVLTNMYPTPGNPSFGTFVRRQVEALSALGCKQDLMIIESKKSRMEYLRGIVRVRRAIKTGCYDLVHAYYGLCGFVAVCQGAVPVVITYCGSDLNPGFAGCHRAPFRSRVIAALGQLAAVRAAASLVQSTEMLRRI